MIVYQILTIQTKKLLQLFNLDELVKSRRTPFFVIPANPGSWSGAGAGIQFFQFVTEFLDSGFHRSDDFLRNHQSSIENRQFADGYLITLSFALNRVLEILNG